jgi:hypothetical protein
MDVEYYRNLVRHQFEGRSLILAGAPLAAYTRAVDEFRRQDAERLFLVAEGLGTGDLPPEGAAEVYLYESHARTIMDEFRFTERFLSDPPLELRARLDAWDPDHEAVLLATPFYYQPTFAGRRAYGWRRPAWLALEDKVVIDEVWDASGVSRAPSEIVPAEGEALAAAARRLDRGGGVAMAGDAAEGFNGGAEYFRWVRESTDVAQAAAFFAEHCDRVRVMPFLDGIPCSIHGYVMPGSVIAFRPCELMTLRRPDSIELRYAGAASFWDPDDDDRVAMRFVARKVGAHLRKRVDYRGGFTVDGILTEEGFLPTELNTRPGAALGTLLRKLPDLPIGAIQRALVEGEELDFRPADLEELIVTSADQHRGGGGWTWTRTSTLETVTLGLRRGPDGRLESDAESESGTGTLAYGPGAQGGFVRFTPDADATPRGPSFAPQVVEAFRLADELWQTDIGSLVPAPDLRR